MQITLPTTQDDHRIAWLTAAAVMIHIFESAIPTFLPGLKPGLANIVVIAVLVMYDWRTAAWVSILRVLVGSLVLGTFLSPTFLMSLSGALASVTILWLASRLPGKGFSAIGYSLLAAIAHISGQFVCAYVLFIPHAGLWRLFPIMLTIAVVLGMINGIICQRLVIRLKSSACKPS
ncbi:MAG: heptaprenyl diphosphate synthase [Gammaproteobacteria bacterium]|nr:heptaprenyl diphosphate synthase [Gammaproteobacteria bacterium]